MTTIHSPTVECTIIITHAVSFGHTSFFPEILSNNFSTYSRASMSNGVGAPSRATQPTRAEEEREEEKKRRTSWHDLVGRRERPLKRLHVASDAPDTNTQGGRGS